MAKKIKVDPAQLETVAGKILTQAADYEKLYLAVFTEIEGLNAAWKGEDNVAYYNQIKEFKPDLEAMKKIMDEFSGFLTKSATAYKETQGAIKAAAGKLAN